MNSILSYILKANIAFSILYCIYYVVFRPLTFHKLNRIILLIFIPLSLVIPSINLNISTSVINAINIPAFEEISSLVSSEHIEETISKQSFSTAYIIYAIYMMGVFIYTISLIVNILKLLKIKHHSQPVYNDGYLFLTTNLPHIFSFFNWIFIPEKKIEHYELPIIEHEKFHFKLLHTVDLILMEIFSALFWFNPFILLFKKSLKSVHEYQVDEEVLNSNVKKSQYLQLMLDNLTRNRNMVGLYNYFNNNIIKKRVKMITRNKTHKLQLIRYLLLIPVITIMAMSSPKTFDSRPNIFPLERKELKNITQIFGKDFKHPITKKVITHGGIDIRAIEGTPVLSTADGIVINVSHEDGWGKLIVIDHGNGYETWYAHLKDFSVKKGDNVKQAQNIGFVGNTGHSTGPHLHYEVRLNGERVNPMDYFEN
jgi:beta-lactamase regulating signal transducer with metallopeptidase domain